MTRRLVTIFALNCLFLAAAQTHAQAKNPCDPEQISGVFGTPITVEGRAKEEIDSFATRLNSLNLEFIVKAVKDRAESREEMCYELGKLEGRSHKGLATWRSYSQDKLCWSNEEVKKLSGKVENLIQATEIGIERLRGYCLPHLSGSKYAGKAYVTFTKDAEFFALFDETILGIVEFQDWAWHDLNAQSHPNRGRTPEWISLLKPATEMKR